MTGKSIGGPLTGEAIKRVFESFAEALANAHATVQPGDKQGMLRSLAAEMRDAAVAMESDSVEIARALHVAADNATQAAKDTL